jgi:hypothetical protein
VHRSHLPLLVVAAAFAACSRQKDPEGTKNLSRDSTLIARIDDYQNTDNKTDKASFPDACGTFTIPAPTPANEAQAKELNQQAYDAEMLGNMKQASSLLHRASELDGTDKSAAYHYGRVSEALGDREDAIKAYCRYLALSPTKAERTEARQRLLTLSQAPTQMVATAPVTTQKQPEAQPRHAKTRVAQSSRAREPKREIHSTSTIASGAVDLPARSTPAAPPTTEVQRRVDTVVTQGDGAEVSLPAPVVEQPRPVSRGPSRAQTSGIGAVAGAIIGGVAGRNAKSAAIGAVAGGILGAVVPRRTRDPS